MTKEEAIRIANEYLVVEMGAEPEYAGRRCEFTPISARLDAQGQWHVLYRTSLPDSPRAVVDMSVIVLVDSASGEARFMGDVIM